MAKRIIQLILIFSALGASSQGKSAIDLFRGDRFVANQFYNNMDFRSALHFYDKVLEKNDDDGKTKLQVAKCHLKLDDPVSAQPYLADLASSPDASIEVLKLYSETLRRNGETELAMDMYREILEQEDNNEIASKLEFLENLDYYTRNNTYELFNLEINSEQSDFSFQNYKDNYLFLSSRQTEQFIQHQPSTATNEDEGMLRYFVYSKSKEPTHLHYGDKLKAYYHDGPLSFNQDYNRVAFTRNNLRDATKTKGMTKVNLKIYLADCPDEGLWQNIIPFDFNSDEYSVGHPALSSDGKVMYFASDMPGGYGGPDLYMTTLDSGKWSQPINLGNEINTSGDELFPSIKNDSILYFASSGLGGFGGLDLFVSTLNNWTPSKPKNMSSPLNSEADDFAIMVDSTGRNGYFSSNRTGGKGYDDIYSFETILFAGVGKVISRQDQSAIPEASVNISMKDGSPVTQLKSDSLGIVKLSLPYDQDFLLSAGKDGYSDLYKVPYSTIDNRISFDTLLIPLWRDELFAQGRIFSNETQELIPDATIVLINKDNGLRDSVVTNEDGTYYFPLAPDSRYHLRVLHDGFIENGLDINTDKIYEGNLLNDMLLEEVYVDKMIVYFDFDAADLNSGYNDELKKLLRTLKKYPKSIINIAAHADARGEETYNKNLSNDRLKAVTTYFRRNGIKNKRIHGTAFGEELLLNQCSDGVVCEEEDHSKNRRAEIKVQLNAIH